MSSTTQRLLDTYAEPEEGWSPDDDEARSALELEEKLSWGITLFRGLAALEANIQGLILDGSNPSLDGLLEVMPNFYAMWVAASENHLQTAERLVTSGCEIAALDEFRFTLEEARCIMGNLALESAIRPVEELLSLVRPGNPDPIRYGE